MRLRDWPANVVPRQEPDVARAVELLCRRGQWTKANRYALQRVLEPWFAEGWHVQAVLHALDHRPDGSPQSRVGSHESCEDFVKTRLAYWYDESPHAHSAQAKLPPPKPGLEFGDYMAIVQERRRREGVGDARPLSTRGEHARRQALQRSRTRADPVQRRRSEDHRIHAALESLRVPGAAVPYLSREPAEKHSHRDSTREIADFAGRRSLVRHHPRVRRCVQEIADAGGSATAAQLQVLRGAVLEARQAARLASLDASVDVSDGELSPQARRILDFVENVIDTDAPVEALLAILEQ